MNNIARKKTRLERVAALELPPGKFLTAMRRLRQRDMLLRLSLCLLTAVALWLVCKGWLPPFGWRTDDVPARDLISTVTFRELNPAATESERLRAKREARYVYVQDSEPLVQLRAALRNAVVTVQSATTFTDLDQTVWKQFAYPLAEGMTPMTREKEEEEFEHFRAALADDRELVKFQQAVAAAMSPFERRGLLEKLPPEHNLGNQKEIFVRPVSKPEELLEAVQVEDVLIHAISGEKGPLRQRLTEQLQQKEVCSRVFNWMRSRLVPTLRLDPEGTLRSQEDAAKAVADVLTTFPPGHSLAKANRPLGSEELRLLLMEYDEAIKLLSPGQMLARSLSMFGLIVALFVPCGAFIYLRNRTLAERLPHLCRLLLIVIVTAGLARWLSADAWRAALVPLLLFSMTMTIVYSRELALLLSAPLAILLALSIGRGLESVIVYLGVISAAILQLNNIRSRVKMIKIGVVTAVVAFALTAIVGMIDGRPVTWPTMAGLLTDAGRNAVWALLVGFLLTGLLPFIERWFGVLTDISLLELADAAHPLLQELVRRAPGTYNHSINVASLAEAAADSIGARGLLVRVGAYFHDIGKMLKPGYFVENQGDGTNRHESLVPAMSTLIIIAHIKDGADLARQHHLPRPIIDFIEQHHGTTLVEYFYRRASEQSEADPDAPGPHESAFRYPGPKPQSREAGVMMLADAVESAGRVLVEPTASRIEGLVEEIAMKRLLDGQFDESGLTLQEIRGIQDSLVKSLIAVYHGRVKYPDQRTA